MDFSSLYNPLFCKEDRFEEEDEVEIFLPLTEADDKIELSVAVGSSYLISARKNAVEWITKTSVHLGFSVQTALLAVNYFDRCFLAAGGGGLQLQEDRQWMVWLATVACLSLAAKIEETRVPLLFDMQVRRPVVGDEMGYVFENRTIRRMELLVLSTLGWRMNPVTPLSIVRHLLQKTPTAGNRRHVIFSFCEAALLSVLADWNWVRYPPSVWAAAALLFAVRRPEELEINIPFHLLNIPKENVDEAYQLILEFNVDCFSHYGVKRKGHCSCPGSPKSLLGSCFTCESSSTNANSLSSFTELPPLKKQNTKQLSDSTLLISSPL